jgi:S-DNA-T family DNA segregation ATPase FtsK/SpoIIIE
MDSFTNDRRGPGVSDPPRPDFFDYRFPELSLLKKYEQPDQPVDRAELNDNRERIKKTLEDFGIRTVSIEATVGPTVTFYEVVPEKGVRIAKVRCLDDDIASSLSTAPDIRIIAPIPGKGTIGIEIPNKNPQTVSMESVVASREFSESNFELPVALGRTVTNGVFLFDLAKMPHLLVAGAAGQGQSTGLHVIITSLLYKKHPAELKFVFIDPKGARFNIYKNIERQYLVKLPGIENAILTDSNDVIKTLKSLCCEIDNRYERLLKARVYTASEYNRRFNPDQFMPYIIVVIDEFSDLIMIAGRKMELLVIRIAQKARTVGIHMIIATQRPSTDLLTGTIRANFPARLAFKVSSVIDSRVILNAPDANKLAGRGDMIFSHGSGLHRVQCALVGMDEIENIVNHISNQVGFETVCPLPEVPDEEPEDGRDPLFEEAARLTVLQQQASTALIQRKFAIEYDRAGQLMDQLEAAGIVSVFDGKKCRRVLIADEHALKQKLDRM